MDKGAHFYRCDFQVHSPRDRAWKGLPYTTSEKRKLYAEKFIAACREKKLDAVAITDHHDLCFYPYIREAAKHEKYPDGSEILDQDRIIIFPGIELTLKVPCQAIIIFDADFPIENLKNVLTSLAVEPSADTEPKTANVQSLEGTKTFELLKKKLDEHAFLKGKYIILPNVTSGGQHTLLRQGIADEYRTMHCVGGYLDGSIDKCVEGDMNIITGQVKHYGFKKIALFQTSDSRSEDHVQLGSHSTWVKWTTPTAEALRQACLAQESRIWQDKPRLPSVIIKSIQVSDSKFMGKFDLKFNPQYTAIIGSRGTGKSTILEYIRWALCDEYEENKSTIEKASPINQRELIENTLGIHDATVNIHFEINNVPHFLKRESKSGKIFIKIGNGELEEQSQEQVRKLLPIQAYSQKQLSRIGERESELDQFIRSSIKTDLDRLTSQIETMNSEIRQVYSTLRRKKAIENSIQRDTIKLNSLTQQGTNIRESLIGLTEEQQELIARQPLYMKANILVNGWREEAKTISTDVRNVIDSIDKYPSTIEEDLKGIPEIEIVENIRKSIISDVNLLNKLFEEAESTIQNIISKQGEYDGEIGKHYLSWSNASEIFDGQYQNAKSAASSHDSQLIILSDLDSEINEINTRIRKLHTEKDAIGESEYKFAELRSKWFDIHKEIGSLYEEQCKELTKLSEENIKATALKGKGVNDIIDSFANFIKGSNVRSQKVSDFFRNISNADDSITIWNKALEEFEILANYDPEEAVVTNEFHTPILTEYGFNSSDVSRIAEKLMPENWIDLVLTPMKDKTIFEYKTKNDHYIPFEQSSSGQQATAILLALLNQSGPPLIIDQPEDDLDNQIVFDIVNRLWTAKTHRQIIFSSHNANLVVNGDAELVVYCDYRVDKDFSRGHIAHEGAIDIPDIRDAIKSVMEGGDKAFKLRLDKYGF